MCCDNIIMSVVVHGMVCFSQLKLPTILYSDILSRIEECTPCTKNIERHPLDDARMSFVRVSLYCQWG